MCESIFVRVRQCEDKYVPLLSFSYKTEIHSIQNNYYVFVGKEGRWFPDSRPPLSMDGEMNVNLKRKKKRTKKGKEKKEKK